jgi:ribosomal protein S18 acetylase RimI-like enzyme
MCRRLHNGIDVMHDVLTRHALPSFVIRPPRGRDLQSLHHLVDSTYAPMIAQLGIPDWPLRSNIPQLIHSGTLWVLESEGLIAAMIRLDVYWKYLWLELVTVLPQCQRCGFGRALVEFAQAETCNQGRSSMQLMTHERMRDAIDFYLHMGFVEVQRRQLQGHAFIQMGKARFAAVPMSDATPGIAVLFSARHALWRIDKNITAAVILVICHAATSAGGRAQAIARAKCPHEHQEQGGSHNATIRCRETITRCEPIAAHRRLRGCLRQPG